MSEMTLDEAKVEAFGEKMVDVLNHSMLAIMTSIGHEVGLFDAMADSQPGTSQQIAEKAGLDERYVREWLGAMFTGGVVEYDPDSQAYRLPPEHAMFVTRAAGPSWRPKARTMCACPASSWTGATSLLAVVALFS